MTNTIPNVPRELLEELRDAANESMNATTRQHQIDHFAGLIAKADALLSSQSPAGVDGLEVVGWYTEDHLDDKSATTYSREVADRWLAKGWPVNGIANAADAQAIIDGLRGDLKQNDRARMNQFETIGKLHDELDQQAQRTGELEAALEFACKALAQVTSSDGSGHADIAVSVLRMAGTKDADALHVVEAYKAGAKWRINAALYAGKEGE